MAQFDALAKRYRDIQERLDFRTGLICSVIANCNRTSNSKTFEPQDFMPKKREEVTVAQSPDAMLKRLMMLNAATGGKIIELNP